ncbi:hypothetical protein X737_34025 [Mesorhizobium sp. L48C026A00]|nr:hypothetical protein X737_34025 [Mesorhizobium sp. L48C026A00]
MGSPGSGGAGGGMRWPNRTPHVLIQVWLLRRDTIGRNGMLPVPAALELPGLARGTYRVIA